MRAMQDEGLSTTEPNCAGRLVANFRKRIRELEDTLESNKRAHVGDL